MRSIQLLISKSIYNWRYSTDICIVIVANTEKCQMHSAGQAASEFMNRLGMLTVPLSTDAAWHVHFFWYFPILISDLVFASKVAAPFYSKNTRYILFSKMYIPFVPKLNWHLKWKQSSTTLCVIQYLRRHDSQL